MSLMIEEIDAINRNLEQLVAKRTSELRSREEDLQAQNVRFDTAINNMTQGLLLFDSSQQLVVCNQRYMEMYGLSAGTVKPGCSFREIIAHRKATGSFAGDEDEYCARILQNIGLRNSMVVETRDGRSIQIVSEPLADGGWVATHEDITERRLAEEQIRHLAHYDALTNLPNRALFHEKLKQELARMAAGEQLAVLCIDIDEFKSVNDTLGHLIGDELLKSVAASLSHCVAASDFVARLGGDEFAIVQTAVKTPAEVTELVTRVFDAIREPYECLGHQVTTDASIGIALAPEQGGDLDQILKNADLAMYAAKSAGRRTYRFFEPEMDARMKARRDLEMDLRNALTNKEFELHYQPLVNLESNEITSFEALLRWHHPKRGLISPADFIPIAEETGLIIPLGEWVLRTACNETANWPNDVKVAVNLSPSQIKSRNLIDVVTSALEDSGMPAKRLQLEITETVLMHNTFGTLATLHKLRELGVQIAMDDFGTGYSSLSYLRSFPFDKIKIDRSFIQDISSAAEPLAIVHAVAGLAKCLNMVSTAEGVETQQQMETLQNVGCTEMQGYFFSKAKPAAEIVEEFLKPGPKLAPKGQVRAAKKK